MRRIKRILSIAFVLLTKASCATIDCPLDNMVYAKFKFSTTISYTLTVAANISADNDSILFNRGEKVDSVLLPMSYRHAQDVYYFQFTDDNGTKTDTLTVSKQDRPHFESVDCNPSIFHTITGITSTHHVIDSVAINNKEVTYDARKPHIILYLKSIFH